MGVYKFTGVTNTVCIYPKAEYFEMLDPKHKLRAYPALGTACNREGMRGATLLGPSTGPCWVCRGCWCNCVTALLTRHGKKQLEITAELNPTAQRDLRLAVEAYEPEIGVNYRKADWDKKWNGAKRSKFEEARRGTLNPNKCKSFVKIELYHKMPSSPRLIQYYFDYLTQEAYALTVVLCQKAVCQHWGLNHIPVKGVSVCFASGLSSTELGQWMQQTKDTMQDILWYEFDMARWDARQQRAHREWYYNVIGHLECLVDFLKECENVTVVNTSGKKNEVVRLVVYYLMCTVKSGHNDTTLGNSVVNALEAVSAMHELGLQGRVLVMGDDCLIAMRPDERAREMPILQAKYGLEPEFEFFTHEAHVSFISGCWWPTNDGGYWFSPRPGRLLRRLSWTTGRVAPDKAEEWRAMVASSLWQTCKDMPIIRCIIRRWYKGHKPWEQVHREWFEADFESRSSLRTTVDHQPHEHLDAWFCSKYGITLEEMHQCEALIDEYAEQSVIIEHPALRKLSEWDTADPTKRECETMPF